MGYKALVPITHRNYQLSSILVVFPDGQALTLDSLEEEHIEQAVDGLCKIFRVEGGHYFMLSVDGQEWQPVGADEYEHVA